MSGHGGVEKVIERMYKLERKLNTSFFTISLTDGNYIDDSGKSHFTAVESSDWIPHNKGKYLRLNLLSKRLNFVFHVLYVFFYILCNRVDGVIATGPIQPLYLSYIRKVTRRRFFIFGWPHFSATSGFGDFSKFKSADKILCISKGIMNQMQTIGISTDKIKYFPNPFDNISKSCPEAYNSVSTDTQFLYIGRFQFEKQKNIKELIKASSLLTGEFKITLIGDGEDYNKIKDRIDDEGLSSKYEIIRGWQNDPWEKLKFKPDALVLTSAFEGLPTVLGEALSRGIPCISSACETGPEDFIEEKENGYMYKPGEYASLAQTMQLFIDGKVSFSEQAVKESINKLYVHAYITRFNAIMDNIYD